MADAAKRLIDMTDADVRALVREAVRAELATAKAANDEGLLPTKDAAKLLGKSTKALLRLVARGKIEPDVWGRRGKGATHLFSRATLAEFSEE